MPYVWGSLEGNVAEERRRITRSGFADLQMRFSTNILGGPALTPAEFFRQPPKTTLGFSLFVSAPSGEYDPTKLINISAHRWAFKPELGVSHPMGKWIFEAYAGIWFFTENTNFFGGQTRSQAPIGTFQAHVSYTFLPRLWLAADGTYYTGGRTTVNGRLNADLQTNSRIGLTAAVPIQGPHSIKLAWSRGATTRIGANFTTYQVTYQFLWFDRSTARDVLAAANTSSRDVAHTPDPRSASTGATREARQAGIQLAATATPPSAPTTAAMVAGSAAEVS